MSSTDCFRVEQSQEFVKEISELCRDGHGFVPLIGAGVSAPSGVPLISEVKTYLHFCISLSLGIQNTHRWNPRRDAWPAFHDIETSRQFTRIDFRKIIFESLDPESSSLRQEAFGAMADWKSALLFLSRIETTGLDEIVLGAPHAEVVDTFFLLIVGEHRPSLAHRMLAELAQPMRMSIVLTTNFDELVEEAFIAATNRLTVFDVHVAAGLPHFNVVRGRNSLIKLHGGRYGLRADYSLDAEPTERDRQHFISYLLGKGVESNSGKLVAQNHLFVVGVSASDARIISFIREALSKFDDSFRIFWVAHSSKDVENIRKLSIFDNKRFRIIHHSFLGFLLTELYQRLRFTLPPGEVIFPLPSTLSLPVFSFRTVSDAATNDEVFENYKEQLNDAISVCVESARYPVPSSPIRFVTLTSDRDVFGLTSIASEVFFRRVNQFDHCLWLDLSNVSHTVDLFEQIVHSISYHAGIAEMPPATLNDFDYERAADVLTLVRNSNENWIIFLNAREGAGVNVGFSPPSDGPGNGWLDLETHKTHPSACCGEFIKLVRHLTGRRCPQISIVLVCENGNLVKAIEARLQTKVICLQKSQGEQAWISPQKTSDNNAICKAVDGWLKGRGSKQKAIFLYSICLLEKQRFPALLFEIAQKFCDVKSQEEVQENVDGWLESLEKLLLVRRKPGAFYWIHWQIRETIRAHLENKFDSFKERVAVISSFFASWHAQLFASSEDTAAAFEAIKHYIYVIDAQQNLQSPDVNLLSIDRNMEAVLHVLKQLRPRMLSRGFANANFRRLEHLQELIQKLKANIKKDRSFDTKGTKYLQQCQRIEVEAIKLRGAIAKDLADHPQSLTEHEAWSSHVSGNHSSLENLKSKRDKAAITISMRAYTTAQKCLDALYDEIELKRFVHDSKQFSVLSSEWKTNFPNLELEVAKVLQRQMQMHIVIGQAIEINKRRHLNIGRNPKLYFDKAKSMFCKIELIYDELGAVANESIAYGRQRANSQMAMAMAYLGRYTGAAKHLDAAKTWLYSLRKPDRSQERGIIELYRTEIFARQASFYDLLKPTLLTKHRLRCLTAFTQNQLIGDEARFFEEQKSSTDVCDKISKSRLYLSKARESLAIADRCLVADRQNVWWTTMKLEQEMKLIELTLFSAIGEKYLPYIDPSESPYGSRTPPDRVLDSTLRMVRTDVYRLARIVESYTHCVVAIAIQCKIDDQRREVLRDRWRSMERTCREALMTLTQVYEKRQQITPKISTVPKEYVEHVIKKCGEIINYSVSRIPS